MTTQRMITATRAADSATIYFAINAVVLIEPHGSGSTVTLGTVNDERLEKVVVTDTPATLYGLANT